MSSPAVLLSGLAFAMLIATGCAKDGSNTPSDWIYPGAQFVENETVEDVSTATKIRYQSDDDPEKIQKYYLKLFAHSDWQLNNLQTNRIIREGVHNGGMSGLSSDQREYRSVNILREGSSKTFIWITHIPDLEAVRQSNSIPEKTVQQKTRTAPSATDNNDGAPSFPPKLEILTKLINERDAEGLVAMGTKDFQRINPARFLKEQLETVHVESTRTHSTSTYDGDVCMILFSYEITRENRTRRGFDTMFWTLQEDEWCFHNLPIVISGDSLPPQLVKVLRDDAN